MVAKNESESPKNPTTVEQKSERELVVTRSFNGPARIVFEMWTKPELFQRWWMPKSCGVSIISCQLDVRTGGTYRLELGHPSSDQPMAFFGRYVEVIPNSRIVWTNEEAGESGPVTTVTFEEKGDATRVVVHESYPSKQALEEAVASGSTSGWGEQFEQLGALVEAFGQKS